MVNKSDQLKVGEKYKTLELKITKDLNDQFLKSLDCLEDRFQEFIHPGLLFNFCSITKSPSFSLEAGIAAVAAKFESVFHQAVKVNSRLKIQWEVVDVYERRSRTYQVCDVTIWDSDNLVMERKLTNTFIGGAYLEKRVQWEKDNAYRRSVPMTSFPQQRYEIVGKERRLSMQKMRLFSGGDPGLDWPARNIHTDREVSIRSGIGRPVASGFMFEGYLSELLISFFGKFFFQGGSFRAVAIDMAGDGDSVIPKMVLEDGLNPSSNEKIMAGIWCENQYGNKIMIGEAAVPKL